MTTYGKMGATVGEKCGNISEMYTSPCCYEDHDSPVTQCKRCGAPLKCYIEEVPNHYCEIVEPGTEDD